MGACVHQQEYASNAPHVLLRVLEGEGRVVGAGEHLGALEPEHGVAAGALLRVLYVGLGKG